MKRPNKKNYIENPKTKPLNNIINLSEYSKAQDKYINHLEQSINKVGTELSKITDLILFCENCYTPKEKHPSEEGCTNFKFILDPPLRPFVIFNRLQLILKIISNLFITLSKIKVQ
jgi:hypothetical protein